MYSNSMHNNMMRRGNSTLRTIVIVVVALLFLYGLFSYHDLHTRHKRSEEKADRLRQQHDSLSAQLQVVYEQKSRLDKLLQQEKTDHKQSKDDITGEKRRQEQKFSMEKQELLNRINSINSEHKMLQTQHEELQDTVSKLQSQLRGLEDDYQKRDDQHQLEYQQLRQEKDNEVAQLKDQVANYDRRNSELQTKLHAAIQQNQISQSNLVANMQDQQRLAQQYQQQQQQQQQQLQQQQQQIQQQPQQFQQQPQQQQQQVVQEGSQNKVYQQESYDRNQINPADNQNYVQQPQQQVQVGLQQNQQQQVIPQQQQQQQLPQQQQAIPQQQVYDSAQQNGEQQAIPQQPAPNFAQQDLQQQQQQFDREQQQQDDQNQQQQQQQMMQLAQPDDNQKAYFEPKEAKPDHEVQDQGQGQAQGHAVYDVQEQGENRENLNQQQQMAAPQFAGGDRARNDALVGAADQQDQKIDSDDHLNDIQGVEGFQNHVQDDNEHDEEDRLLDRGGFNRINQMDRNADGGGPLAGPNVDQAIGGGAPDLDQGQILGPEVKDTDDQGQQDDLGPFKGDDSVGRFGPAVLNAAQNPNDDQMDIPARGQLPDNNGYDNQQDNDQADEQEDKDEDLDDDNEGDQLDGYPVN